MCHAPEHRRNVDAGGLAHAMGDSNEVFDVRVLCAIAVAGASDGV